MEERVKKSEEDRNEAENKLDKVKRNCSRLVKVFWSRFFWPPSPLINTTSRCCPFYVKHLIRNYLVIDYFFRLKLNMAWL